MPLDPSTIGVDKTYKTGRDQLEATEGKYSDAAQNMSLTQKGYPESAFPMGPQKAPFGSFKGK